MGLHRLKEAIEQNNVFLDIDASDRMELIREIVKRLAGTHGIKDTELLAKDAMTREMEMSTGIENGIALPHARTKAVQHMVVAFARPTTPVDFKSPDNKPADLVFFSAIPAKSIEEYLKFTAHLVRTLHTPNVAEQLRKASTTTEIMEALDLHNM